MRKFLDSDVALMLISNFFSSLPSSDVFVSQSTQERIVNHHTFRACLLLAETVERVSHLSIPTNADALQVRTKQILHEILHVFNEERRDERLIANVHLQSTFIKNHKQTNSK